MASNKSIYEIIAKAVGFKQSEKQVKGLKESLGGLKTAALGVAGAYFGSQALISGIKASVQAFGEQEAAEKKLEQALGRTSTALLDQASAMQRVTVFGDEAVIAQMAFLGSIGMTEDQISDILPVAADLAEATGMTLESAVRNTAKTFSGLAGELGELVPQLRDLTAEEMKAGDAVKVMADLFGGQALSATKTFEGQAIQVQNALGDVSEVIGEMIAGGGLLDGLADKILFAGESYAWFFGQFEKRDMRPFAGEIESTQESIDHLVNTIQDNNSVLLDQEEINGRVTRSGLEEEEVRQAIIDTTIRYTGYLKIQNDELERLNDNQKLIMEDGILVNESLGEESIILSQDIIPAKMFSNQLDLTKQEHSVKVRDLTDKELAAYKRLVAGKKAGAAIEVAASSQIFGSFAALAGATGKNAELVKNLTIAQAIADTYAGANKAYAQGGALGIVTGTALIAAGLANVIQIQTAYKDAESRKQESAQYGFEGVVDEPTQFTVGEGGAAEYVSVTPMEGVNNAGGGGMTIVVQGNVMTDEFVEGELADRIADAVRRGTDFGIS